jgi:glycerate-2-kinase
MIIKNYNKIIENGQTSDIKKIRTHILDILSYVIKETDPYNCVKRNFCKNKIIIDKKVYTISDYENTYLIGFGKASIKMAQAVCDSIKVKEGIVITNDSKNKVKSSKIETFVGGHPIPNLNSIEGTTKIINIIKKCKDKDILIVLISGGGSTLLCKPKIKLEDLRIVTDLLLKSGAEIKEINTVRKHISDVKGGQLIKNAKCHIISLILSDIIGDPISFIASGPTYHDSTSFEDALIILKKYSLWEKIPISVKKIISDGLSNRIPETPKWKDKIFEKVDNYIVANNNLACYSAVKKSEELGYKSILISNKVEGEARKAGQDIVNKIIAYKKEYNTVIFISGGETTVKVTGKGKGGRNQEMVLSCVESLADKDMIFASFATDGIDGKSIAAGAIADGNTLKRALDLGLQPLEYIKDNNSYGFFNKLNDNIITGITGTNVMDIQIAVKIGELS